MIRHRPPVVTTMGVLSAVVLMIYAVVLLVMMLLPGTRAALDGHAPGYGRGDGYDENGYEDEPRRRRRDEWEY